MCKDCYDNCAPHVTDKCVEYTGADNEELGICKGDKLVKVEEIVLNKLLSILNGSGITPKDITIPDYVKGLLNGKDPNFENILQVLLNDIYALRQKIDSLTPASNSFTFNKACLTISGEVTRDKVLQSLTTLLCYLKGIVDSIPNTYVKNEDLKDKVGTIASGAGTQIQYNTRLFPNAPTLYIGDLANFDNTGKGIALKGFDRVFILNGLNGTPDWRGRVGVGAVRNIPGGTLETAVDPSSPLNPSTNYGIGEKGGENYHKSTVGEMPKHTHEVIDNGHDHNIPLYKNDTGISRQDNGLYAENDNDAVPTNKVTAKATTGITLKETGSNLAHENRQPFVAGVWIIYKPE